MRSALALVPFLTLAVFLQSQEQAVKRPRILGIDHVAFYTTQPDGVKALYSGTLGLVAAAPVEAGDGERSTPFHPAGGVAPKTRDSREIYRLPLETPNL